jgi:4-amino-4-deoxy-L-arabinose transferase-like glycosyltransferase
MQADAKSSPGGALVSLAIAAGFFVCIAPTLSWLEFSSGSENLVVATALEMRRTRQWMLPTLAGEPRLNKPPLTTWIAAAAMRADTLRELDSPDAAVRAAAYGDLSWQVRWPALLCACLTLAVTFQLGQTIGGRRIGVASALVHGTTYAFLRFSRAATTDVQLALWVMVANLYFARAVLDGRRWRGCIGGGIALGLAFLSKGPVAIAQAVVPVAAFYLWRTRRAGEIGRGGRWGGPVAFGCVCFMAVAAPWFVLVAMRFNAWNVWYREVMRSSDATGLEASHWFNYLTIFTMMIPWVVFFVGGFWAAAAETWRRTSADSDRRAGIVLALLLLLVPILIMSLFRDRKERYLLPMAGAGSILVAYGIMGVLAQRRWKSAVILHWVIIGVTGIGMPILAATPGVPVFRTLEGQPWLSMPAGVAAAMVCGVVVVAAWRVRRRTVGLVHGTLLVMLVVQGVFAHGYSQGREGRAETRGLAEIIREKFPTAPVYSFRPGRRAPEELAIYLNRTIRAVSDLGKFNFPAGLTVLVVYQEPGETMPAPAGWTLFTSESRGKGAWHAYFRRD